jgi:DNA-binding LytR/AlgR family response regulator
MKGIRGTGNFSALVLDDEKSGRDMAEYFLKEYASDLFGYIYLVNSIESAQKVLESNTIDVAFIDIELKGEKGLQLAKYLSPETLIVVISAYPEYALQAIKINVVDYLLKPILAADFELLITKLRNKMVVDDSAEIVTPTADSKEIQGSMVVREGGLNIIVPLKDVHFIEAAGAYSKIVTANKNYIVSKTLKALLPLLPDNFTRIHRSYIVPQTTIASFKGNTVWLTNGKQISLSKTGRKQLQQQYGYF